MTAKRLLIIISASFAVVVLGWVALIGAVYAWGGVATVRVHDQQEGLNIYVPVPMALVDAAVATGAIVIPEEEWLDLDVELGEWGPMVRGLLKELEECPDFTLVEVEDDWTHVKVYKQNGSLKVEVDDQDVTVRVSVPIRSARRTLSRLTRLV